MSIELAMENAKLQSDVHDHRMMLAQMRKYLAGALCSVCGESLGDGEIIQDDNERTIHLHCEEVSEDEKEAMNSGDWK